MIFLVYISALYAFSHVMESRITSEGEREVC